MISRAGVTSKAGLAAGRVAAEIGGHADGIACDVTDEAQVTAAVDRAKEDFGGVDILVNGAALFNTKGVLDMPYWANSMATDRVKFSSPLLPVQ